MKTKTTNTHSFVSKKAFTLIELLTVIAIIGILAGILIPVVGRVRETAKKSACASNVRQIGTALLMYADDSKGYGPTGNAISKIALGSNYFNFGLLLPYLSFNRPASPANLKQIPPILTCPGADPAKIRSLLSYSAVGDCPYYMNNMEISPNSGLPGQSLASLPTRRVAIADQAAWWTAGGKNTSVNYPNHGGKGINVFRLDGSVSWLSNEKTTGKTSWSFSALDDVSAK